MIRRVGQQVLDGADGFAAGSLVLFENDGDAEAGADVFALTMRHIRFRILDCGFWIETKIQIRDIRVKHQVSADRTDSLLKYFQI
jgi:hypothetical protein